MLNEIFYYISQTKQRGLFGNVCVGSHTKPNVDKVHPNCSPSPGSFLPCIVRSCEARPKLCTDQFVLDMPKLCYNLFVLLHLHPTSKTSKIFMLYIFCYNLYCLIVCRISLMLVKVATFSYWKMLSVTMWTDCVFCVT